MLNSGVIREKGRGKPCPYNRVWDAVWCDPCGRTPLPTHKFLLFLAEPRRIFEEISPLLITPEEFNVDNPVQAAP